MSKSKLIFSEIENKLLRLQAHLNYIDYISNKENYYFENVVESSSFLYISYFNARKLLIIDICIFLNHKENNNFVSYIKSINSESSIISNQDYRKFRKEIRLIVKSDLYRRIRNFRNKFYVHDDPHKINFNDSISIDELKSLVVKLQEIYNTLYSKIENTIIQFDFNCRFYELGNLYKFEKLRNLINEENRKVKDSIEISKLIKILRGK